MATTSLTEGIPLEQLNSQQISELQRMLIRLGYDAGPVDGVMGPKTRAAYNRFLSRNGYKPAGGVTIVTLMNRLASGEDPDLWGVVSHGGEVDVNGQPVPDPQAPAPPPQETAGGTPAPTAAAPPTTVAVQATTPAPILTDGEAEKFIREQYPYLAYLLDNPEIRPILMDAAMKGDTEQTTQARIRATTWWNTTAEATRVWDSLWEMDNAEAMQRWNQRTASLTNLVQQMGVPMDAEGIKWVAGRILREGWTDEQLNRYLGQLLRNAGGAAPGRVTETQAELKALARSYLVNMNDKDASEYAIRIAEGSTTQDAISTMLRQEAKNRFTWLAPQIDSGITPIQLFASTRNAVAQELEIDPETIDLNDARWSALTSPVVDGGQQRSINFAEAQTWARQRPEWRFTRNANDSASNLTLGLLKAMGVIA